MSEEERLRFEEEEAQRSRVRTDNATYLRHHAAGLPLDVALVGCSSKKRFAPEPVSARELYVGRLARLGYQHAVDRGWDVHFLSALHHVVEPHQIVEPYDFSMARLNRRERIDWGRRVVGELVGLYVLARVRLILFAGETYVQPIVLAMNEARELDYWTLETPLRGLDLFGRFRWFRAHAESAPDS